MYLGNRDGVPRIHGLARKQQVSDVTLVQAIELMITMDNQTGAVGVNGPIHNKILCLGMLELAKQAILAFDPTKAVMPVASMPKIHRA